jgi:hypothetical protein
MNMPLHLLDEVLMGTAFCCLVSAAENSGTEREDENDEKPSEGDTSIKQRERSNVA